MMLGLGLSLTMVSSGSASSFTPLALGNRLVAWYSAGDISSVTESGGVVSQWRDKSGNGYHFSQSSGAKRPLWDATSFRGVRPGITFDGIDDFMEASGVNMGVGDKFAAFIFCKMFNPQHFLDELLAFQGAGHLGSGQTDDISNPESVRLFTINGDITLHSRRNGVQLSSGGGFSYDAFRRFATAFDGSMNTFYVDDIASVPVASTGNLASPGILRLAASPAGNANYGGVISEIVVTRGDITSAEMLALNRFFVSAYQNILIVDGDSIPFGDGYHGYGEVALPTLANTLTHIDNIAIPGTYLAPASSSNTAISTSRLARTLQYVALNRIPGKRLIYSCAFTNNTGFVGGAGSGIDVPAYVGIISSYVAALKAAGVDRVIWCTTLSRGDGNTTDEVRNNVNAAITAPGWKEANGVDAIADFASVPIMGTDGAWFHHPEFFLDLVHPNTAGYARLAPYYKAAVDSVSI